MATLLAIETSCDETAAAIIAGEAPSPEQAVHVSHQNLSVLSNVVASQIDLHKKHGGIVPEVASRQHAECINLVIQEALDQAGIGFADLHAVGVTYAPGLIGSLMVGLAAAKAIAIAQHIPLLGVNHLEGHLYSCFLQNASSTLHQEPLRPPKQPTTTQNAQNRGTPRTALPIAEADFAAFSFPFLCLIVSGGHTSLVLAKDHSNYQTLGETKDDACGEAFDKVARLLGLGYPGGPVIDRLATQGDPKAVPLPVILPGKNGYDFSYSGLKTAVANTLRTHPNIYRTEDIAASFQAAALKVLLRKARQACQDLNIRRLAIVGGVSANSALRQLASETGRAAGITISIPPLHFSTDNAAMIGIAAYLRWMRGETSPLDLEALSTQSL